MDERSDLFSGELSMRPEDHTHQEELLSDDVYRRLKAFLLSDVFRPPERLQIGQLSRHFGTSITPIREALIRLAAEHIIDAKPGRGFFYKDFSPSEQIKLHDLLFCLLKHAVESRGQKPFHLTPALAHATTDENEEPERTSPGTAAAVAREHLYRQLVLPLGNEHCSEMVGNLCERTRISRILWLEQLRTDPAAPKDSGDWIELFQAGKNLEALDILRRRFQAKARKIHALANGRQHRIYEVFPLLRPGSLR
jgi:DNA-binding GntR family transcriptional regulator